MFVFTTRRQSLDVLARVCSFIYSCVLSSKWQQLLLRGPHCIAVLVSASVASRLARLFWSVRLLYTHTGVSEHRHGAGLLSTVCPTKAAGCLIYHIYRHTRAAGTNFHSFKHFSHLKHALSFTFVKKKKKKVLRGTMPVNVMSKPSIPCMAVNVIKKAACALVRHT